MSNISEQYRKPLMSDETGKAIAQKLGGDSVESESESVNISEQYRKPLMSEETAQAILEKIDGGGGGGASALSELSDVNLTSPSDGQVLHYDGTEWINATPVAELPAVTSDDNGDVLTVVEGAWAKAEPSGGSQNILIITGTYSDSTLIDLSMTYSEIQAARQNGAFIFIDVYNVGGNTDCIVRVPLTGDSNYLYGTGVYVYSTSGDDTFYVVNVYMSEGYLNCYANNLRDYT